MKARISGNYEVIVLGFDKSESDLRGRLYGDMHNLKVYLNEPAPGVKPGDRVLARITDSGLDYLLADVVKNLGCSVEIDDVYNVRISGRSKLDARDCVGLTTSEGGGIKNIFTVIQRGGLLKRGQSCEVVVKHVGLHKERSRYYLITNLTNKSLELNPNKTIFYAQWQKSLDPTLEDIVRNNFGVPEELKERGQAIYLRSDEEFRIIYPGWIQPLSEKEPVDAIKRFITEYKRTRGLKVKHEGFMLAVENTTLNGLIKKSVEELNRKDKNLELRSIELRRRR